jgi:acetyl esterase/lipase
MRGMLLGLPGLAGCSAADLLNGTITTRNLAIDRDVAYAPGPRHDLDIYRQQGAAGARPLIVFLYGGSWRDGDKSTYPFVAATLAKRGAVVMVPNYRLYPEVAFPGFLQDNAAAVAWAIAHAAQYGADPADVFIVGHSAGAYNAAMLALDPKWLAAAGVDRATLRGVVGLAGPYDFLPITGLDIIPVFAPVQDGPASQPITFVDGHNPPMLLLAGDADTTVYPRNTTALAAKIAAAGGSVQSKIYPGIGHIGLVTAVAPVFSYRAPVLDDVWAFITAHEPRALDAAQPLR